MKCVKITKSRYKNKYEKNIAQKLNEIDQSPDIELEWDNLKNIINYVELTLTRTLAGHIFSKPTSHLKRLLFRFLWPLSFHSLHPRFHTTPLYSLAIQQNATPRTYHYSLWRILLPLRSVHG